MQNNDLFTIYVSYDSTTIRVCFELHKVKIKYMCHRKYGIWENRVSSSRKHAYNFDLLKPQSYVVKMGFTRVYIIFIISAQNIDCAYSLEPPRRGGSNEYPQYMF